MITDNFQEELVEEIESMTHFFLLIEKQKGHVSTDQFSKIFRILHNLKGTLGMCDHVEAAKFVHYLEDEFKKYEGCILQSAELDFFIDSCHQLYQHLVFREKLILKLESPAQQLNEYQIDNIHDNSIRCIDINVNSESNPADLVLLISNQDECRISQLLNDLQLQFLQMNCPNDFYKNRHLYSQIKTIIICTKDLKIPFTSFTRVINRFLNHVEIIVIGNSQAINDSKIFYSDIHFHWIGDDTKKLNEVLAKKIGLKAIYNSSNVISQ